MNIDNILTRLNGVKRTGHGRYVAKCPAHQDRSPSLAITQKDDRILIHCFSGCPSNDVLAAIGLGFTDLFPERVRPDAGKQHKFNAYDVLACLKNEAAIIRLAAHDAVNGTLKGENLHCVELAESRISEAFNLVFGGRHG